MTRDRLAAYVLALCVLAAVAGKLARIGESLRDLDALARGLGIGRPDAAALTWILAVLSAGELAIAAALVTTRHRRRGLVALLLLLACGVVAIGIASRWGARRDFGCPCGLAFQVPFIPNYFIAMLVRDAALAALAAIAWGADDRGRGVARVSPA